MVASDADARRRLARECALAGIDAAHPETVVRNAVARDGDELRIGDTTLSLDDYDDVVVLGGGNAASQVAAALEDALGDALSGGVVVTDDPAETKRVEVLPGDHPVPSERGVDSTRALCEAADAVDERTLVLAVITGGASALLPAPTEGLSLGDLRATTDALLDSGATIHEVNAVRKHCSALKGGRFATRLAPARVATLVFSDVVGDDLSVIGSGPTVPDPSTYADALAVLDDYDVTVPEAVRAHLEAGRDGEREETPGTGRLGLRARLDARARDEPDGGGRRDHAGARGRLRNDGALDARPRRGLRGREDPRRRRGGGAGDRRTP